MKARNSQLYAAKTVDHNILIATALEEAEEWLLQNSINTSEDTRLNHQQTRIETRCLKPAWGWLKCNVHASWIKDVFHCGRAWLLRNHDGDVVLHVRDTFLPMFNKIAAELHCILWCLQSLHQVHVDSCEIWSKLHGNHSCFSSTGRLAKILFYSQSN